MNIFKTTTRKIVLLILIFAFTFNTLAYANYNPSREELEAMIDEVALKRAIPAVILKSIARVESVFEHFNSNGSPKISGSSIGLMQVNNRNGGYNTTKLKYDVMYNIEAGAEVLLNKWSMSSYKSVSSVGNMDPAILENWYFALWAYNGWSPSNNPNMLSTYGKRQTYQQIIYKIAENEYNQKINSIDISYLPKKGNPSRSLVVPTPTYTNCGNIILYEKGDYVRTDGIRDEYQLRDVPAGKYIYKLGKNQLGTIIDGPVLQNGYYWYKVQVNDNCKGWIERNCLLRTGDIDYGRYVYDDISFHWARKAIMELYNKGVISEATSFNPEGIATKEEFLVFLSKAIDLNKENIINLKGKEHMKIENDMIEENVMPYSDTGEIHAWAIEHIKKLYKLGLLKNYDNEINPLDKLTRKEAARLIENIFGENSEFTNLDIRTIFTDLISLKEEEISAVKSAYTSGIMSGKYSGCFCPGDYISRAEAASIMVKIINKLESIKN